MEQRRIRQILGPTDEATLRRRSRRGGLPPPRNPEASGPTEAVIPATDGPTLVDRMRMSGAGHGDALSCRGTGGGAGSPYLPPATCPWASSPGWYFATAVR